MKPDIHPKFHEDATINCACGHVWTVGSTVQQQNVETCGVCHPYWTGEQKIVDTEGRVERMRRRYNMQPAAAAKKPAAAAQEQPADGQENAS